MFSWINFEENENDINVSNIITSNSQPDRFQSLITYLQLSGRLSISHILSFNISGIVKILVTAVYQQYPHLYPEFQSTFKAQQTTEKIIGVI